MSPAAFIDANVPIYASGREHANKEPCARVLMAAAEHPLSFVTDVEVLQELVHRYLASGRWTLGREVLQGFAEVMYDRTEPVYEEDIHLAARLADRHPGISARDLVHAAVMQRLGADRIISVDADFDRLPGVIRLDPAHVGEWGDSVLTCG
jgi:predicted nucleic acid-binding protein